MIPGALDQVPLAGLINDDPRRALDDLITRALAYRTGPELRELLKFSHRFPHIADQVGAQMAG